MTNPRADFFPIIDRKPLKLPGNARIAVWVIVNIEEWPFNEPMARTVIPPPQGATIVPDIANYGWYDYGMRVGIWRIIDVLDRHGVRASVSLNGSVCSAYPRIVDACLKSRWSSSATASSSGSSPRRRMSAPSSARRSRPSGKKRAINPAAGWGRACTRR